MTTWLRAKMGAMLVLGLTACEDEAQRPATPAPDVEMMDDAPEPVPDAAIEENQEEPIDEESLADEAEAEASFDAQGEDNGSYEDDGDPLASVDLPRNETLRVGWVGSEQLRLGQPYEYTIRVQNASETPVSNVVVRQEIPEGFEILSSEPERQAGRGEAQGASGAAARWSLDQLGADETASIDVTAVAHRAGDLRPCLHAEYESGLCPSLEVVQPELTMTMEYLDLERAAQNQVYACDDVSVAYTLSNRGSGETQPVTVRQPLPEGFQTADGEREVMLEIDSIDAGESVTTDPVSLEVANAGQYSTSATASTDAGTQAQTERHTLVVMRPDLAVRVDGPQEEYMGREIAYQVEVENTSEYPARDVRIRVPMDESARRVSYSTQQAEREGDVLEIGRLEAGETRSFTLRFEPASTGEHTTRVTAEAYCVPETADTITTQVRGIAAAQIEVVDDADPVRVGEEVTYDVAVLNEGTGTDLNVGLSATIPEGMEFVEAQGISDVQRQGDELTFSPVSELEPGDELTWQVVFRATEEGRRRFAVEMTSDATTSPVRSAEPTRIVGSASPDYFDRQRN